jgi:hypothetical protein
MGGVVAASPQLATSHRISSSFLPATKLFEERHNLPAATQAEAWCVRYTACVPRKMHATNYNSYKMTCTSNISAPRVMWLPRELYIILCRAHNEYRFFHFKVSAS